MDTSFRCHDYASSTPTTTITAGGTLDLAWALPANHPGDCSLWISYDADTTAPARWVKLQNFVGCTRQSEQPFTGLQPSCCSSEPAAGASQSGCDSSGPECTYQVRLLYLPNNTIGLTELRTRFSSTIFQRVTLPTVYSYTYHKSHSPTVCSYTYQVQLPDWLPSSSHAVLRWEWYAVHVYTEFYANCVDVVVSGGTAVDAEAFYAAAAPVVTIAGTAHLHAPGTTCPGAGCPYRNAYNVGAGPQYVVGPAVATYSGTPGTPSGGGGASPAPSPPPTGVTASPFPSPPPSVGTPVTWEASLGMNCYPGSSCPVVTDNYGAQCNPCCGRDTWYSEVSVDSCKARCVATAGCDGITAWSKCPPLAVPWLGSCASSGRACLGSSALPGCPPATGTPATAPAARASHLQSRRLHCL